MARPTVFRQEYCKQLIDYMAQGFSFEGFGAHIGVGRSTLYNWVDQHPSFMASRNSGREASYCYWEKLGIDGCQGKIPGFNGRIWILMMRNMHGWSNK
jgi:hypothetical protein